MNTHEIQILQGFLEMAIDHRLGNILIGDKFYPKNDVISALNRVIAIVENAERDDALEIPKDLPPDDSFVNYVALHAENILRACRDKTDKT